MEDILISIAADTKELVSGLAEVEEKGGELSESLGGIGAAAGVAFAGFSASILGAVYAYREQEQATIQVNQEILATGGIAGVTAEAVNELAESFSNQTTYSKTAVTAAEAVLLSFTNIGKETFPEATQATLDLAAGMHTDLASAASLVGRALQDPTTAAQSLRRAHIQLTAAQAAQIKSMAEQGNTAGAQALIIQALEGRFGGMSQAVAGGTGVFLQVKNAMEDLTQAIGARLAPTLIAGATWLRDMIQAASQNQPLVDMIAHGLAIAAAFTGVIAAVTAAVFAFQKISAVIGLASTAVEALGAATGIAMSASGVGLILVVGGLIYAYWNQIWPAMLGVYKAFVQNIALLAKGLGNMLLGAVTMDLSKIEQGWAQVKLAVQQGIQTVGQTVLQAKAQNQAAEVKQSDTHHADLKARNLAYQQQILADQRAHQAALHAAQVAANQVTLLEETGASAELIALKKKEAQDLKTLADESFTGNKAAVQRHLDEIRALENQALFYSAASQAANDSLKQLEQTNASQALIKLKKQEITELAQLSQTNNVQEQQRLQQQLALTQAMFAKQYRQETLAKRQFDSTILKENQTFQKMSQTEQKMYIAQHEQTLTSQYQTESSAQEVFLTNELNAEIAAHNQFLQDQIKFGTTYAELNEAMHSAIYTGTKTAFGDLANLTQSSNSTLKSIGKAAAVANIVMKTYESAMNIFAGFSTIPIVGYALGIAGAAAAVAFGVEQLGQVQAMAGGGLVTGGIAGVDSVPLMAQQGELVVPKQNFNDVVSSYAKSQGMGGQAAQPQQVQVQISMHPNAARLIQVSNLKDQSMGVYRGRSST